MSSGLANNIRKHRRIAGFTREGLAEAADLSVATIRKLERGGDARVENLHALARALGVTTSSLFATEVTRSVVGPDDEANRQALVELRRALMPPVGLDDLAIVHSGEPVELNDLRRGVRDVHALHMADRYASVARALPGLLRASGAAVALLDDKERSTQVRAHVLLMTGMHLTQVRQYDMAYAALAEAIRLGRDAGRTLTAATGVNGLCWLLLRQNRFDECEELAVRTAAEIEPKLTTASKDHLALWGELWLRVAAASVRNNRPDVTIEARRMAGIAASAVGEEHANFPKHWAGFGPTTVEAKSIEDLSLAGDSRGVLRRAGEGPVGARGMRALSEVSPRTIAATGSTSRRRMPAQANTRKPCQS